MLIKIRLTLKGSFFPALKSIVFILMFLVPKMYKLEVNLVNSSKHFWSHSLVAYLGGRSFKFGSKRRIFWSKYRCVLPFSVQPGNGILQLPY